MAGFCPSHFKMLMVIAMMIVVRASSSSFSPATRSFDFKVEWKKVRRLCQTKQLLTVNGLYPGPTIAVHEGDSVEIRVRNGATGNTTLHWHGLRQLRTAWADGPAYITQCPIRAGQSYTYRFTVDNQRGTLWWHAHYSWQRASVHGAFIIYPRLPYPFSVPIQAEIPIIFGEWWNGDVEEVEKQMMLSGGGPAMSNAFTINGLPGHLYPCSNKDTFIQNVDSGKTYMLRIINAALNDELFFSIAKHKLTVVEIDGVYTKPFETTAIMITPGQTTSILVTADQSQGTYLMAARPYITATIFPFDNSTTIGFLHYNSPTKPIAYSLPTLSEKFISLQLKTLPQIVDTAFATKYLAQLRSLGSTDYPCNVPKTIDKRVIVTMSLNLQDCPKNKTCTGYLGRSFFASMNNQSFIRPSRSILESYFNDGVSANELSTNFPEKPPKEFDYTGGNASTENLNTGFGSKILVVPYGTNLEIVLQNTNLLHIENHPIHIHGHNSFVVGRGFGNFDVNKDPKTYNLVDPPERNTVAAATGGWAALRLKVDNPGVWFVHCHLEEHTSWGLAMAFVVLNGPQPSQSLLPPPHDLPSC